MNKLSWLSVFIFSSMVLHADEPIDQQALWRRPVAMHRVGVSSFFSDVFNLRGFGPHFSGPLLDFLAHSAATNEPVLFTFRIIDMFHARMKEASWINPYDVAMVLEGLGTYTSPVLKVADQARASAVKNSLYRSLLTRFRELKQDPETVMQEMTAEVLRIADGSEAGRLRMLTVRLIEGMLDRLIWLPAEQEMAWDVTKRIGEALYALYRDGVIPDAPTLNHCLWSLTYRFTYCLDLAGDQFSLATYHQIKHDIVMQRSVIFSFQDERQGLMKSRAEWLKAAIIAGEMRVRQVLDGLLVAPRL